MSSFEKQVRNNYFEWLYYFVTKIRAHDRVSYKKLFRLLHDIEFVYSIRNDENRASDGIDLRYRYGMAIGDESVVDVLDGPCSVLEMLIALAVRCEETIMDDPRYGDRTSQWFWTMMSNLGLNHMTDDVYNQEYITDRIYDFMERRYEPDGLGGLFYIKGCKDDLRDVEIWIQLCWYLDGYY